MSFNKRNYQKSKLLGSVYISNLDGNTYYLSNNKLHFTLPFKAKYGYMPNGFYQFIDDDGFPAAHHNRIDKNMNISDINTWLLPPSKLSNSEVGFIQGRGNEWYLDPETDTYGPNYYMNVLVTYKNGEVYNIYNGYNKSMEPFPVPPYRTVTKMTFSNLPKDEIIYKVSNYRGFDGGYILTQKGNVYVVPSNFPTLDTQANLTKLNISNVVDISPAHWNSQTTYILTEDGSLYYVKGNMWNTPITKIEGLPRIKNHIRGFEENERSYGIIVLGEDNKFYHVMNDTIYNIIEIPNGEEPIDYQETGTRLYLVTSDNKHYEYYIQPVADSETEEITFPNVKTIFSDVQLLYYGDPISTDNVVPYVDLDINYYTTEYRSSKYTNLVYLYRFALEQNISNDGLRNVVNYVTSKKWTPSGCLGLIFFFYIYQFNNVITKEVYYDEYYK